MGAVHRGLVRPVSDTVMSVLKAAIFEALMRTAKLLRGGVYRVLVAVAVRFRQRGQEVPALQALGYAEMISGDPLAFVFGGQLFRMFDVAYYRRTNPDLAPDVEPLLHYLKFGAWEGRNPNALFDSAYYLRNNPDVATARLNPLIHFVEKGGLELRNPSLDFDTKTYVLFNPAANGPNTNPLLHYIESKADNLSALHNALNQCRIDLSLGLDTPLEGPIRLVVGVVLFNTSEEEITELVDSIRFSEAPLPDGVTVDIRLLDNSAMPVTSTVLPEGVEYIHVGTNLGFGKGHNNLLTGAFRDGDADFYLGVNPDGRLHPFCLTNLLRMAEAEKGSEGPISLLEAIQFPEEHPKWFNPSTLETSWVSGACFLMPRVIFYATQGFDESLFLYCEDVDLSWRARRAGFRCRVCPTAIFLHDVSDREQELWRSTETLLAGRYLARKWGAPGFRAHVEQQLVTNSLISDLAELPDLDHVAVIDAPGTIPDFEHDFSFAQTRW